MVKKHVFRSFNLNNSEKHRLSFEDIFLGTLDTYAKKMNPPSAVLGGGVHGKVCWLIAYIYTLAISYVSSPRESRKLVTINVFWCIFLFNFI